ncbi:MAG: glycine cleavage system aminomethyltransferase GcvT [Alphaproteobacteria bacterium]|nr:glycine cleavage system aminomethyltransferase GcvT [Alphaproteobacteria bacterium]
MDPVEPTAKRTPLYALHAELGAKFVPFAGYDMPVHYHDGILAEHRHTRTKAGLFDVSHMGQILVVGAAAAKALEALVPGDIQSLTPGAVRYTQLTNDQGGVLDDLMVTQAEGHLFLVVNASRKADDLVHLEKGICGCGVGARQDLALLALQGPAAAAVLARLAPRAVAMRFMESVIMPVAGLPCRVSRSGYTGEDGFEISVKEKQAEELARRLLKEPEVAPVGLGARDSLRLEAGLCLYGQDLTPTITPVEAGLAWSIGKRRRSEGGYPGAEVIGQQLKDGPPRRRVGIRPEGRAIAREHTQVLDADGGVIGEVSSGGFGPTADAPIAMAYIAARAARTGAAVGLSIRGKVHGGHIVPLPFVPHRYAR